MRSTECLQWTECRADEPHNSSSPCEMCLLASKEMRGNLGNLQYLLRRKSLSVDCSSNSHSSPNSEISGCILNRHIRRSRQVPVGHLPAEHLTPRDPREWCPSEQKVPEKTILFLSASYVCPKPVLLKQSLWINSGGEKTIFPHATSSFEFTAFTPYFGGSICR